MRILGNEKLEELINADFGQWEDFCQYRVSWTYLDFVYLLRTQQSLWTWCDPNSRVLQGTWWAGGTFRYWGTWVFLYTVGSGRRTSSHACGVGWCSRDWRGAGWTRDLFGVGWCSCRFLVSFVTTSLRRARFRWRRRWPITFTRPCVCGWWFGIFCDSVLMFEFLLFDLWWFI